MIMSPSQQPSALAFAFLYYSLAFLLCVLQTCDSVDTISVNQTISDGETIVSAGERFEMGFFSPGNSSNRYIGIWYHKIPPQTIVWVANRDAPINNTSEGGTPVLRLNPGGVLEILNAPNSVIWSSTSSGSVSNPAAQLLDNGNFIIKDITDSNPADFIWQSFDFPVDTFLPVFLRLQLTAVEGIILRLRSSRLRDRWPHRSWGYFIRSNKSSCTSSRE